MNWQMFDRRGSTSTEPTGNAVRVLRGGEVFLNRALARKFKAPLKTVVYYFVDNGDSITIGIALLTDNAGQYRVVTQGGRVGFSITGFMRQMGIERRPAAWHTVTITPEGPVQFHFTLKKQVAK